MDVETLRKLQARNRTLALRKGFHDEARSNQLERARLLQDESVFDEPNNTIDQWIKTVVETEPALLAAARVGESCSVPCPNCLLLAESLHGPIEEIEPLIRLANVEIEQVKIRLESALSADTKTDTGKKRKKKREANAAARVCGQFVKESMEEEPTLSRKSLVNEWCESKNGVWDGKELSVSSIEKMLQENPELWKPDLD